MSALSSNPAQINTPRTPGARIDRLLGQARSTAQRPNCLPEWSVLVITGWILREEACAGRPSSQNRLMSSSITQWLAALRRGDTAAAARLWDSYFEQLVRLARRNLKGRARTQTFDEEDLASLVLGDFLLRYQNGDYDDVRDRDGLWQLLVIITVRRAISQARQSQAWKRGRGRVSVESELELQGDFRLDQVIGKDLAANLPELMSQQCRTLLEALNDPTLEKIALWKLEGHTNDEIAEKLGCTRVTVQRKLRLIREAWNAEHGGDSGNDDAPCDPTDESPDG